MLDRLLTALLTARIMYALCVDPSAEGYNAVKLPSAYLNVFRRALPHLRVTMRYCFRHHRAQLQVAYKSIDHAVEQQGFAQVFATLVSPDDIEELRMFRARETISDA